MPVPTAAEASRTGGAARLPAEWRRWLPPLAVGGVCVVVGYVLQLPQLSTGAKLGIIGLPCLSLAVLLRRSLAGVFLLASLPFSAVSVEGGAGLFTWASLFVVGAWVLGVLAFESWDILRMDRTDLAVGVYAGLAALSAAFAGNDGTLARSFLSVPDLKRGILAVCVSLGAAAAVAVLVPGAAGLRESTEGITRLGAVGTAGGLFVGIDRFGGDLAVAIVLAWTAFRGLEPMAVAARVLSVFALLALAQTVSRAAAVALVVAILAWALIGPTRHRALRVLLAALLVLVAVLSAPDSLKARFASVEQLQPESVSRLAIWEGGVRMFEAHPLLGIGVGNYATQLPRYLRGQPLSLTTQDAHSVFVATLAELGLVGILLLLYVVWRLCREALQLVRFRARAIRVGPSGETSVEAAEVARLGSGLALAFAAGLVMAGTLDLTRDPFLYGMFALVHGSWRLLQDVA